jgi:hypothetical protein
MVRVAGPFIVIGSCKLSLRDPRDSVLIEPLSVSPHRILEVSTYTTQGGMSCIVRKRLELRKSYIRLFRESPLR